MISSRYTNEWEEARKQAKVAEKIKLSRSHVGGQMARLGVGVCSICGKGSSDGGSSGLCPQVPSRSDLSCSQTVLLAAAIEGSGLVVGTARKVRSAPCNHHRPYHLSSRLTAFG